MAQIPSKLDLVVCMKSSDSGECSTKHAICIESDDSSLSTMCVQDRHGGTLYLIIVRIGHVHVGLADRT